MHGFEAEDRELLSPPVQVEDRTRERLIEIVAAITLGATPEEVTGYIQGGFPPQVGELLERPLEREEMNAHVDLMLAAMQTTTGSLQAA